MQGDLVEVDDVNITLIELTVPPLLWSLASPYPLHLVAFEREHEVMEMFCDVARQGNRQIVMETQARLACFVIHMQPFDGVDFLVRLPFSEEGLDLFDRGRFNRAIPIAFKDAADVIHPLEFNHALLWQPFGEPTHR